jgi:hypothetical protein
MYLFANGAFFIGTCQIVNYLFSPIFFLSAIALYMYYYVCTKNMHKEIFSRNEQTIVAAFF